MSTEKPAAKPAATKTAGKAPAKKRAPRKPKTTAVARRGTTAVAAPKPFSPEALIAKAIDKGVDVETMEKLLAMRRELKAEMAKELYYEALSGFQAHCETVVNSKRAMNKNKQTQEETTVRFTYASLDVILSAVRSGLKEFGFSYTMKTKQDGASVTAACVAHHSAGHEEETEVSVPIEQSSYMNHAQQIGTAIAYASRYAFKGAFGIVTGDEDVMDEIPPEEGGGRQASPPKVEDAPTETEGPGPRNVTPKASKPKAEKATETKEPTVAELRKKHGVWVEGFSDAAVMLFGLMAANRALFSESERKALYDRLLANKDNDVFVTGMADELGKTVRDRKKTRA